MKHSVSPHFSMLITQPPHKPKLVCLLLHILRYHCNHTFESHSLVAIRLKKRGELRKQVKTLNFTCFATLVTQPQHKPKLVGLHRHIFCNPSNHTLESHLLVAIRLKKAR